MKPVQINLNLLLIGLTLYLCSTLTSMAGMSIGFACLIGFALSAGWRPQKIKEVYHFHEIRAFTQISLAFVSACILSLLVSKWSPPLFAGHAPQINLMKDLFKLWYFILPFILASILHCLKPEQRQRALFGWLLFSGACGIMGIIQFFTGFPREQIIPSLPQFYHATLFFGHHLSTASILIFPFFISLSLFFSHALREGGIRRLNTGIFILTGVTLILTFSRTLWIALPIGLISFFIQRLSSQLRKWIYFSAFALGLAIATFVALNQETLRERFLQQRGTNERIALWEANGAFIQKRPLLGIGLRKSEEMAYYYFLEKSPQNAATQFVGHAHNNELEILAGTGILGLITWLGWNLWILRMSLQLSRLYTLRGRLIESHLALGIFSAWITFHINGLTQVNFWEGKVMHQMMWSVALLLFLRLQLNQNEST